MIPGIGASLAALGAFGKKLSVGAGNVANTNTDGYKKSVATIKEDSNGLPETAVEQDNTPGSLFEDVGVTREMSNVDLAEEFPQMMIARRGYEANIKALKAQDEVFESTIDILA